MKNNTRFRFTYLRKNLLFTTLFLLGIHFTTQAQTDSARLATIANGLANQTATHPVEKVYLHFNKPGYITGDTLWFKGYVTVGEHHQPSALSGVLYVELIDEKNKIIKSLKLKVNNGMTAGEIATDPAMKSGNYYVRAYTTWMRNAGADYFFNRMFKIGDLKDNAVFVTSYFDVSAKNREGSINARLTYTDKFGRAYNHKQVNYEVKADSNTIYKGTGITDDKGNIMFAFSDKTAVQQKRININSHIKIIQGIIVDKTIPINSKNENTDVQFFPEGGQLITGVRSKVAFKAIGVNGLSQNVKGIITDNDHKEVAEFDTQHAGMGIFAITPEQGKTYTAKIILPDSTTTMIALPAVIDKGFVLAVNNSDSSNITVRIATNNNMLNEKQNNTFYLVAQQNGKICYTTLGKLDNSSFTALIHKSKFATGIVQFTLFSANMEPLNERVVFIQNANQLNLSLTSDKSTYAAKEKVKLLFAANNKTSKAIDGSFSIAVFNADPLTTNENSESTILSNILLTSDLKGYIEEPNYYFNNPTAETKADLDVLMLTQGYRRFNWKDVIADHYAVTTFLPEKGLNISGILTTPAGKPVIKGSVKVLSVLDKVAVDTVSDSEGRFIFPNIEFPDSTKLVIQARKANDGKNVDISLDNNGSIPLIYATNINEVAHSLAAPVLGMTVKGYVDTTLLTKSIKNSNINPGAGLKEVTIKGKKTLPPSKYNANGTLYQYKLNMAQARAYNSVFEAVEFKIPGITYQNGKLRYEGEALNNITVVNGLEFNINYLEVLDPNDIEMVALSDRTIVVTTKSYAGTDTVRLKDAGSFAFNKTNKLKDVTVKAKKADKPDQSNMWGGIRPDVVIDSKTLMDYVNPIVAISVKMPGNYYKNGKLYDPVALQLHHVKVTVPIPVVIDGVVMDNTKELDDVISRDRIEDIKLVQGKGLLASYGLANDPNDKIIIVTTKAFAGTDTTSSERIKPGTLTRNLKEVNVKSRKNAGTEIAPWQATVTNSANLNGPGHADQVITGDQLNGCLTLGDCLQTKIAGITTKNGKYYFIAHSAQSITSPPPIVFIIDGQLISGDGSVDILNNIIVSTIQTVEVLKSSSYLNIYGQNASGGALVITTKIGNPVANEAFAYKSVPGVIYTRFSGFDKARQFYLPKYKHEDTTISPDNRVAVYWNPNIITGVNGEQAAEFYNSDIKGNYTAVVEGIDNDGNIARYVYRYKVQ